MNVTLTTFRMELPAASRIASTFWRQRRVCSWTVVPSMAPVAGSKGPWPATKTNPPATTAWLYENDPPVDPEPPGEPRWFPAELAPTGSKGFEELLNLRDDLRLLLAEWDERLSQTAKGQRANLLETLGTRPVIEGTRRRLRSRRARPVSAP